jgi:NYN domain
MSRSSELGVDVLLAVEMIKHATMREHEYLALVSGDRDYIPLLSYLKDQGQRVIHVATGEPHRDMRSLTWKQVELTKRYPDLCSIAHDKYWIITAPAFAERVVEAQLMLDEPMFFRKQDDDARLFYSAENLYQSLDAFRNAVGKGDLVCKFPYVMRDGVMEAYGDEKWRWMVNGANPSKTAWGKLQTRPND